MYLLKVHLSKTTKYIIRHHVGFKQCHSFYHLRRQDPILKIITPCSEENGSGNPIQDYKVLSVHAISYFKSKNIIFLKWFMLTKMNKRMG